MPIPVTPVFTALPIPAHPTIPTSGPNGLQDTTRVIPISQRGNTDALLGEGTPPQQFYRAMRGLPDPETHIAPPSIMQIEISRILNQQAGHLAPPPEERPRSTAEDEAEALAAHAATKRTETSEARAEVDRDQSAERRDDAGRQRPEPENTPGSGT